MTPLALIPFYLDWTFWTAIVALAALVLSQLPPIHILLRPRRIEVDVHSRIGVTHKVGNPNVTLHLSVVNIGGREVRVRGLSLSLARDGQSLGSLPAQNYFEKPNDQTSVLLVPFSLKPDEYWSHAVSFLNFFDRATEKLYRESEAKLRANINRKIEARPKDDKRVVRADEEHVVPFLRLFKQLFVWEPGEYVVELRIETSPASATCSKKYRFTLFESDTNELRKHVEGYPFGAGIYFNVETHIGLFPPLSEHLG